MKKILIAIVVLAIIVLGGIKLYFRHKVTNVADKMVKQMTPIADVSYGGTIETYGGKLGIKDIEIRPRRADTAITIDAISIEAGSLWAMYQMSEKLKKGELPNHFAFDVKNASFDPTFDWSQAFPGRRQQHSSESLFALNCGHRQSFKPSDFKAMGIQRITTTMHMGYRFYPDSGQLVMHAASNAPGLYDARVSAHFNTGQSSLQRSSLVSGTMALSKAVLHYRDEGWFSTLRDFCAGQQGSSKKQYAAGYAAALWRRIAAMGLTLSPQMQKSMSAFVMHDNGQLSVTFDMPQPVVVQQLRLFSRNELLDYLNPEVTIGDDHYSGDAIALTGVTHTNASPDTTPPNLKTQTRRTHKGSTLDGKTYQFVPMDLSRLTHYKGRMILLRTNIGRFKGTLKRVGARAAYLRVHNWNGDHQALVPLSAVTASYVGTPVAKQAASAEDE